MQKQAQMAYSLEMVFKGVQFLRHTECLNSTCIPHTSMCGMVYMVLHRLVDADEDCCIYWDQDLWIMNGQWPWYSTWSQPNGCNNIWNLSDSLGTQYPTVKMRHVAMLMENEKILCQSARALTLTTNVEKCMKEMISNHSLACRTSHGLYKCSMIQNGSSRVQKHLIWNIPQVQLGKLPEIYILPKSILAFKYLLKKFSSMPELPHLFFLKIRDGQQMFSLHCSSNTVRMHITKSCGAKQDRKSHDGAKAN